MEEDSPLIQAEDGCRPPKLQQDWQIFLALFKAFVGSGLLGLPYAFRLSGVVLASLAVLFVSLFAFYACLQLVRVKDYWGQVLINPQLSYGDLAGKSLGRYGSHLVNAALLITQCGFCVAYLIFMGNTLHSLVSELTVLQWTSVCLVAVMALSVLNYRLLSPLTLVASVAYVFGIVALGVLFMGNRREEDAVVADPRYLAYAISLATYSFEGVGVIAPLHSEAKNPHHFTYLLALTILIVAVITVCFGDLGYLALGNDILPIVTESVPSSSVLLAVRIALVFSLYITYPVQVYPVFEILENEYLGLVEDGRMAEFLLQRSACEPHTFWIALGCSLWRVPAYILCCHFGAQFWYSPRADRCYRQFVFGFYCSSSYVFAHILPQWQHIYL